MGLISAIIGWLQYHLGLRTDAASSSGSLHGKMAELRANYLPTELPKLQKPRGYGGVGFYRTTSTTPVTALNISGRGALQGIYVHSSSSAQVFLKITIDGEQFVHTASPWPGAAGFYTLKVGTYPFDLGAAVSPFLTINFKSSLKIEIYVKATTTATVYWYYELE